MNIARVFFISCVIHFIYSRGGFCVGRCFLMQVHLRVASSVYMFIFECGAPPTQNYIFHVFVSVSECSDEYCSLHLNLVQVNFHVAIPRYVYTVRVNKSCRANTIFFFKAITLTTLALSDLNFGFSGVSRNSITRI